MPEIAARGERARFYCEQDTAHNLEHLAVAVILDAPYLFRAYVRWLQSVLVERGVGAECLRRNLEITRDVCAAAHDLGRMLQERILSMLDEGMQALAEPPESLQETPEAEVSRYMHAALAGQRHEVLSIVARWVEDVGPATALTRIAAAQQQRGELWQRNKISVADEHRATALAQVALSLLVPFTAGSPGERPAGRAVIACAPGDWHAVGPRIAADLLELRGYEVEFLGANTPAEELAKVVEMLRPDLAWCAPHWGARHYRRARG